ncbi:Insecticial toxin [Candidatus Fukatsuia endosymbiont of Tuberolachnus salignus]|uniref:Insecticial toxin n=1 Tax=Candidatus Fukatsuia endosymbiont of Tuberolachnus salignus TaxID=3077957 RepID=UPI00313C412A
MTIGVTPVSTNSYNMRNGNPHYDQKLPIIASGNIPESLLFKERNDSFSSNSSGYYSNISEHFCTKQTVPMKAAAVKKTKVNSKHLEQTEIEKIVARDFISEIHMKAIAKVSIKHRIAITFRSAGRDTLEKIAQGAAAKGHDIMEKTIKLSSIAAAYPKESKTFHQKIYDQCKAVGITGCVGHWDKEKGLIGIYLASDHGLGNKVEEGIYPIDMSRLEESLKALTVDPNWRRLVFTGDYDTHDILVRGGAGRPRTPSEKEEKRVINLINEGVAEVDEKRPLEDRERNVARHGAQVRFIAHMLQNELEKVKEDRGFSKPIAEAGPFPLAAISKGVWAIIHDIHELKAFYEDHGAIMKEIWQPNGSRQLHGIGEKVTLSRGSRRDLHTTASR